MGNETAVSTAQAGVGSGQVYALLADGTTVEIRLADPDDFGAVKAMHEALSPDNTYLNAVAERSATRKPQAAVLDGTYKIAPIVKTAS
jgi:hypothetical protein